MKRSLSIIVSSALVVAALLGAWLVLQPRVLAAPLTPPSAPPVPDRPVTCSGGADPSPRIAAARSPTLTPTAGAGKARAWRGTWPSS